MAEKLRRLVGLVLVIVGLGIISSVVYKRIETNKKQNELKAVLQDVIKDEASSGNDVSFDDLGYTPIGLIEIPSINLSQGLVEGITDDMLQYYIGHFEDSAKPGEKGNFAVAGHRVSNYSEAFVNLYKVKPGDLIHVKSRGKEFIYKVEENFIVNPDEIWVLDKTEEPITTLITCTVGAKQRVVVRGSLIETRDIE